MDGCHARAQHVDDSIHRTSPSFAPRESSPSGTAHRAGSHIKTQHRRQRHTDAGCSLSLSLPRALFLSNIERLTLPYDRHDWSPGFVLPRTLALPRTNKGRAEAGSTLTTGTVAVYRSAYGDRGSSPPCSARACGFSKILRPEGAANTQHDCEPLSRARALGGKISERLGA